MEEYFNYLLKRFKQQLYMLMTKSSGTPTFKIYKPYLYSLRDIYNELSGYAEELIAIEHILDNRDDITLTEEVNKVFMDKIRENEYEYRYHDISTQTDMNN